jgi:hypothetical protein
MRIGGTRIAEIALWVVAGGLGIAAAVAGDAKIWVPLFAGTLVLALAPIVIEIRHRNSSSLSEVAKYRKQVADDAWNSVMLSRNEPEKPPDSTTALPDNLVQPQDSTMSVSDKSGEQSDPTASLPEN